MQESDQIIQKCSCWADTQCATEARVHVCNCCIQQQWPVHLHIGQALVVKIWVGIADFFCILQCLFLCGLQRHNQQGQATHVIWYGTQTVAAQQGMTHMHPWTQSCQHRLDNATLLKMAANKVMLISVIKSQCDSGQVPVEAKSCCKHAMML